MGDLKPCPFCGGNLVARHEGWFDHPKGKCILSGRAFHKGFIGQWNTRATPPEVAALVEASTALRDHIARWHDGGPPAGPDESRALFEALDDALTAWGAANAR